LWFGEWAPRATPLPVANPLTHLPLTPGGPPVWIAAGAKPGMRRALRMGAGLALDSLRGPDEIQRVIDTYRELAAEAGVPVGEISIIRRVWLGSDAEVKPFLDQLQMDMARYQSAAGSGPPLPWMKELADQNFSLDAIRERVWAGEPEKVAEGLVSWCEAAGIDYVVVKFHWGRQSFEEIAPQIRLASRMMARASEAR
jgi:alkanesulfonate monooxygenase SsuD/methylene tetrahydromethanopterin reductase-like flavin-dependent oxidoreductase (luciferase family)